MINRLQYKQYGSRQVITPVEGKEEYLTIILANKIAQKVGQGHDRDNHRFGEFYFAENVNSIIKSKLIIPVVPYIPNPTKKDFNINNNNSNNKNNSTQCPKW